MAREKTIRVVLTFSTTTDAMKLEKVARLDGIPGRMIPVPRQLSAGCGLAWSAPQQEKNRLAALAEREKIRLEGVHELLL